jgi:hypothetical protein
LEVAHALLAPSELLGAPVIRQIGGEARGAAEKRDEPIVREIFESFDYTFAPAGNDDQKRDNDNENKEEQQHAV